MPTMYKFALLFSIISGLLITTCLNSYEIRYEIKINCLNINSLINKFFSINFLKILNTLILKMCESTL